jgi:hypothetical protein
MLRSLYGFLLALHPAVFRQRFADEMLCIFDEASATGSTASLLADAGLSLTRQWLVRSGLWIWAAASIAGLVPLLLAFGSFLPWDTPFRR